MSRNQHFGLVVAAMLLASMSVSGQVPGLQIPSEPTILQRSPFIPPDWDPPRTNQPAPPQTKEPVTGYEFRGVFLLNNEYRFLVSEPKSRSGKWVRIGGEYEDFEVRSYNADSETLTLFYNSKEEAIKLADVEANPSPMPVSGQVRSANSGGSPNTERTVRRSIRPTTARPEREPGAAPPPPAWLQRLREEAAARRAQASGSSGSGPGGSASSGGRSNPSVEGLSPPNTNPGEQPTYTPPPPPQELLNMDIPPPPTSLPPEPNPEVQQMMLESMGSGKPGS